MDSPTDGDELARVVPLRRRDRELTATPAARGSLPRERAPFDPEIEPGDTPTTRILRRRTCAAPQALRNPLATSAGVSGRQTRSHVAAVLPRCTHDRRRWRRRGDGRGAHAARTQPVAALPGDAARVPGGSRDCGRARAHQAGRALGQRQPIRYEGHAAAPNTRRTVALRSHRAPSETNPGAVDSHPLHRSELDNQEHSLCGPRLLPPENLVDEQRRRCARNPKPPRHTLDAAARLAVDAYSRRARLGAARARLRPPIDQFLDSRAFLAQVHRPIPDT